MAKFKDYYDGEYAKLMSDKIKPIFPSFNENKFIKYINENIDGKEFNERQDIFANGFKLYLTQDYKENIQIFEKILGPELKTETGMFSDGWWLWPVGRYVELFGAEDINVSLNFIEKLTKRFTGEFAMRPLLESEPKMVLKTVVKWSKDENVHLRRLSSECLRIRLPWAKKIYVSIDEFSTYKEILSNLRNDKSKFVQKSVWNNLNDLYKEFSEKAMEIINEWKNNEMTKETEWIINHGLRSLKKK